MRAKQGRDLGAGLRKAENVVDKEQNVLALIAEVFGDREARKSDAGAGARRFVHLAVDQGAFGFAAAAFLVDARFNHLPIEIVALAGPLADARKHRIAAVRLGDVVDQLHDQHCLADAGAAKEADLAALGVGRQQIDNLDAGDQDLGLGRLLDKLGSLLMDGTHGFGLDRSGLIDRLADHVDDTAQGLVADRHRDRIAGVDNIGAPHQAFGRIHGDGAHRVLAQMLGDLEHQPIALIVGLQGVHNRRQRFIELNVHDGAHNLTNVTNGLFRSSHSSQSLNGLIKAPRRPIRFQSIPW